MNQINNSVKDEHIITVMSRSKIKITCVEQLISYDEFSVVLSTSCGNLDIDGEALHVDSLDLEEGCATVSGCINGFNYQAERRKRRRLLFNGNE